MRASDIVSRQDAIKHLAGECRAAASEFACWSQEYVESDNVLRACLLRLGCSSQELTEIDLAVPMTLERYYQRHTSW
jgi:hypothetical protein